MSDNPIPNRKLLRVYKRVLSDFKMVWAIKRHYETMAFGLDGEEFAPVDLNRIYGTLKVLYQVLPKSDVMAVVGRLESAARDIVSIFEWFGRLDEKITPYDLRSYLERSSDITTAELRAFSKYFLNKQNPTQHDLAKTDYLITRLFSWVDSNGVAFVNQESEERLESEIRKLLPKRLRKPKTARTLECEAKALEFTERLRTVKSYDELINSGLINEARAFKARLGLLFYDAGVLSKSVQLNVQMRNHFEHFMREENQKLRQMALDLIGAGTDVLQDGADVKLTATDVLEFSEQAREIFSSDYSETRPYLEQVSYLRNLMQRRNSIVDLDPYARPEKDYVGSLAVAIEGEEDELTVALKPRIKLLDEQVHALQTRSKPSAVKVLHLENSSLVLSSWEFDVFKATNTEGYFARLSFEVLKKAVALIAELQENAALYRKNLNSPQLANTYLMGVNFYVLQTHKLADELEHLANTARDRNDIDTACNLLATRQKLLDSCNRLKPLLQS